MEQRAAYGSWPTERPRLVVVHDGGASYSALPHAVMDHKKTTHGHIMTYAVLQRHWWQGGECWASHATLATEAKCSERQLQRYLRDLVAWGFITERRRGHGQAKAYAPLERQHDNHDALKATPVSDSDPNTTPVSDQHDTGVVFNTTPVSDRRRRTEEDSLKEEHSGGVVAADAAPAPPAEATGSKKTRRPRRTQRAAVEESSAPPTIDLTDQSYETAEKWGFDRAAVDFQLDRFLSKARSKGWTYADWKAGFRTWLLNEVQYAKRDGRAVPSAPSSAGRAPDRRSSAPQRPRSASLEQLLATDPTWGRKA